jgi:hypothetical protein
MFSKSIKCCSYLEDHCPSTPEHSSHWTIREPYEGPSMQRVRSSEFKNRGEGEGREGRRRRKWEGAQKNRHLT